MIRRLFGWLGFGTTVEDVFDDAEETPYLIAWTREGGEVWSIPIDRATEYVPELGNIRSCVRPEEYVYDWQTDGL